MRWDANQRPGLILISFLLINQYWRRECSPRVPGVAPGQEGMTGSYYHGPFGCFRRQKAEWMIHIRLVVIPVVIVNGWNWKSNPRPLRNMLAVRQCHALFRYYLSRQAPVDGWMPSKTFSDCTIQTMQFEKWSGIVPVLLRQENCLWLLSYEIVIVLIGIGTEEIKQYVGRCQHRGWSGCWHLRK